MPCQEYGEVEYPMERCLARAVHQWACSVFGSEEVATGLVIAETEEERYLVDFAVRQMGHWRITEVWVEGGEIRLIADLGEGLPAGVAAWPWPEDPAPLEGA
jgi:hypothetical protein